MSYLQLLNGITAANGAPVATACVATITTVAGAALVDGERVFLSDGQKPMIFEFDTDGLLSSSFVNAVRIPVTGLTADQVRDALIAAINGAGLDVIATSGGAATVLVTHNQKGPNLITISETVANGGFAATVTTAGALSGVRVGRDRSEVLALEIWTTGAGAPVALALQLWAFTRRSGLWQPVLNGPDSSLAPLSGNDARRFEVLPAGMEIPDWMYLQASGTFSGSSLFAHLTGRLQRRTA